MSNALIQSYVWYKDKKFYVSTINRISSAMLSGGAIYAETMAWLTTKDTLHGEFVGQGESAAGSLREHFRICQSLFEFGKTHEDDE